MTKKLGQIFNVYNQYTPTKASVYLRLLGTPYDLPYFEIGEGASIDASNFSRISQGDGSIYYTSDTSSWTGSGFLRNNSAAVSSGNHPRSYYPIKAEANETYDLWVRGIRYSGDFTLNVYIDDAFQGQIDSSGANNSWGWFNTQFTIEEDVAQTLSLELAAAGMGIDKVYLLPSSIGTTPTGEGPDLDAAAYLTVHCNVWNGNNNALGIHDWKTTLDDILDDGEYNFDLNPLSGSSPSYAGALRLILAVSGASSSRNVTWEYCDVDPYLMQPALAISDTTSGKTVSLDRTRSFIHKIWSDYESLNVADEKITLFDPVPQGLDINDFTNSDRYSTELIDDSSGGNDIALDIENKNITLVVDNSGSMSWNDSTNIRDELLERLVNKASAGLSNPTFNIFKFGGKIFEVDVAAHSINNDPFNLITKESTIFTQNAFQDLVNRYSGVRILRKTGSFPSHELDGEIVFEGDATKITESTLTTNTNYYYKIFVYDNNFKFSSGKELFLPYSTSTPAGIPYFGSETLIGYGLKYDSSAIGLWHFEEGEDAVARDFTSDNDLTITDGQWVSELEVDFGKSALRCNGSSTVASTSGTFELGTTYTVSALVYPFSFTASGRMVLSRDNGVTQDYALVILSDGRVQWESGGNTYTSTEVLTANSWNHILISVDNGTPVLYVNNIASGSGSIGSTGSGAGTFRIGLDNLSVRDAFFGYIKDVGIYTEAKTSDFVSDYDDLLDATGDTENGDRLVVFKWFNKNDADYLGGNIKIVKKEFSPVSHAGDGTAIYDETVVAGENEFTYREDFISGVSYYFKAFSETSAGILSSTEDSQNILVQIPSVSSQVYQRLNTTAPTQPAGVTLFEGNRKNYITWSTSSIPDEAKQILIYMDTNSYPTVDSGRNITGTLVFQGLPTEGEFYHYNLDNDKKYYYTLVYTDATGRPSVASIVFGRPKDTDNDEDNIPVNNVDNIRYDIQDENAVIFWDRFLENKSVSVPLTDNIVFFARLKDELGNIIENEDVSVSFEATASAETFDDAVADKIDNETDLGQYYVPRLKSSVNVISDTSNLYRIALDELRDGIYKGVINRGNINAYKNIRSLNIDLKLVISLPNLTYTTSSLNVLWENPFDFSIDNFNSETIEIPCNKRLSALEDQVTLEVKKYNGGWARSNENLLLKVPYTFDLEAGDENIEIISAIYAATGDLCSDAELGIGKAAGVSGGPKTKILTNQNNDEYSKFTTNLVPVTIQEVAEVDDDNNPTGGTTLTSFANIQIVPPSIAENVWLYIKAKYRGYTIVKRILLVFKSPLVVELKPRIPLFDGRDIAEQKANVYLVDTDDPTNPSKFTLIDGPKLKWELIKKNGTVSERPFYSNDSDVSSSFLSQNLSSFGDNTKTTVYSNTEDGVADNVFFGPIYNTNATGVDSDGNPKYDEYDLVASLSYDGLLSVDKVSVELNPFSEQSANQSIETSNFLMEFDDIKQEVYADGIDFARLNISHDPANNYSKFASCFNSCMATAGKTVYELTSNNSVRLEADDPDVEIIWGDVSEVLEPYGSRIVLDTSRAKIAKGSAFIGLTNGTSTTVYLRYNKFLPDQAITGFEEGDNVNCSCLNIQDQQSYQKEITITGSMTTLIGGQVIRLVGGGSISTGIPPTVLVPKEPLELIIPKKKATTDTAEILEETVYGLAIDGVTKNKLTYNLKFAGLPVPDDTNITLTTVNTFSDLVSVTDNTISTVLSTDSEIDPLSSRSYATATLNAIQPGKPFEGFLLATVSYDESGETNRSLTSCVRISSTGTTSDDFLSLFSQRLLRYNTSSTTWFDLTDMAVPRALHVLEEVSSKLYAIGGVNSNGIKDTVEEYDIATDSWTTLTKMPTPRMAAQSAVFNNKIYVIGGIEFDRNTDTLKVSTAVERYTPATDTWETLEDMPLIDEGYSDLTSYGVAFGHGHYASVSGSDRIYVLSGIRKISEDGSAFKLNNRVHYYDISSNTWTSEDEMTTGEMEIYGKISPNVFEKSGVLYVVGGARNNSDDELELLTNGYKYTFSSSIITEVHDEFDEIVDPRMYAAYSLDSTNNNFYVLGGWGDKSQFTKKFESFDTSGSIISRTDLSGNTFSGAISGAKSLVTTIASAPYSNVENVFLSGGFAPTKGNNFLRIITEQVDSEFEINNNETQGLKISFKDEDGEEFTSNIDVIINGYVQSLNINELQEVVVQDKFVKYPIRYVDNTLTLSNGVGVLELRPRSDDYLKLVEENMELEEGQKLYKYKIVNEIVINDVVYNGRTFVNTVPVLSTLPSSLEIDNCFSGFSSLSIASLNPALQGTLNKFNVLVGDLEQEKPPVYNTFVTGPVIGDITQVTTTPLDATDTLVALDDILESPFGPSPLYDTLKEIATYLSDSSFDDIEKTIYIVTDDEENGSNTSLDQAIEDINAIDGEKEVPIIVGNLNLSSEV